MVLLSHIFQALVASATLVQGFAPEAQRYGAAIHFGSKHAQIRICRSYVQQRSFATQATLPKATHQGHRTFKSTRLAATTSNTDYDHACDVLVLGSGPAARALASLLSVTTRKVIVADANADRSWPPNYGVWEDEWTSVCDRYSAAGVNIAGGKVGSAIDRKWNLTDCFFGGSFDIPMDERTRIDRPYYRVDKHALQDTFTTDSYQIIRANHFSEAVAPNIYQPAGSILHDADGSTIQLKTRDDDIVTVRSKLVVDCTGHETKLVLRNAGEAPPGYQIAYGCLVDVDLDDKATPWEAGKIGPYDREAMTLFDYRTDHLASDDAQVRAHKDPTFMYAMPLFDKQIFFEETSLVARPAVSFQECKDRCIERLAYHGIRITKVHEEEFCYIPMGGALPLSNQRIMALGGAAAMVHPATGYHLCRCLTGAADVAQAIARELDEHTPNLDHAAAAAYHALWSPENIRQRNFVVFGGEFLMKQNVVGLRGFFNGFFRLPLDLWAGFLAGWPGLPYNDRHESWIARIWYGLNFIVRLPPKVALDMVLSIVSYIAMGGLPLAQSVTPFLGKPESYEYKRNLDGVGDVAAKMEARRMISASLVPQDLPVAFGEENKEMSMQPAAADSISATSTPEPVGEEEQVGTFQ